MLLAADLASLSPADGAVAVAPDSNLVLTFSDNVQKGPGTGNILIRHTDSGELIETINVNSDRVTIDGNTVTIDPVNDLPDKAFISVEVDPSAVRDTSTDTATGVLLSEDFEGLILQDSDLANDDINVDVNDYVVTMTGVLNVLEAGEYTFGINADDGQKLAIDVAQDGLDVFDDEIIVDDTTHGTQDRLHVCGLEETAQSCVGTSFEDPIQLDVGEYAFEMWYFERGGGSSGEFFYAKGLQEIWDPNAFVLVGDDSQGIGVTADGITATTYKADSVQVGNLETADLLILGEEDLAAGFPVSAQIPTADVWNTGGNGRFTDNHPLPGFPAPTAAEGTDWTDVGPQGWTRDNRDVPDGIPPEFAGWTFLDKFFWINQQGNQSRIDYTNGENVIAVADNDAFGDFTDDPMNAGLSTPKISLTGVAENTATVSFDSSWSHEDTTPQVGRLLVEFFDDSDSSLGENELFRWTTEPGDADFKDIARDEAIEDLALGNPANAASMTITWDLSEAGDNRWWAIDNVVVEGTVQSDPFDGISAGGWNFNTFSEATLSFTGSATISEDGGEATLTVIREGVTDSAVSVDYSTSAFTASADDFTAANGTLEFAAGETEKSFTVSIVDDDVAEADEFINVLLSNPGGGAELGNLASVITIVDNDRSVIVFQEGVEVTVDGAGTGVTYEGTSDADPAGASPDDFRDRPELNPDGSDGGEPVHALTKFDNIFGDGAGQLGADAVIGNATLSLNITNEGTPLTVHRLLFEFNQEEITWNDLTFNGNTDPGLQADGLEAEAASGQFATMPAMLTHVDVTGDVKAWQSGDAVNYGWGFLPTGTNGVDWDSAEATDPAVRPKLSIEFANLELAPSTLPDVTAPGDTITRVDGANDGDGNDGPPPGAETVENAINDVTQKYLNFLDLSSGFVVTPSAGRSLVQGIRLFTANDSVERDPASYLLEGSNDGENFTVIAGGALSLPDDRNDGGEIAVDTSLAHQELLFPNTDVYTSYRVTFPTLKDADAANSMQIAEVELLGTVIGGGDTPEPLVGDIDEDGTVGFSDFLILSQNFGMDVAPGTDGDLDGDGTVAFADFLLLSGNFGATAAGAEAPAAAAVDAALAVDTDSDDDDEDDGEDGLLGLL